MRVIAAIASATFVAGAAASDGLELLRRLGPAEYADTSKWGGMCGTGKMQSPIDIVTTDVAEVLLHASQRISDSYTAVDFPAGQLELVDKNYIALAGKGEGGAHNELTEGDEKYRVLQAHTHFKSEHSLNGKLYPAEVHFVHQAVSDIDAGIQAGSPESKLLVLGWFLERGTEQDDDFITKGHSGQEVNMKKDLPMAGRYWRYYGSLTTPPCTEVVQWHVFETPLFVKASTFDMMLNTTHEAVGTQGDNRPPQPLNGRLLTENTLVLPAKLAADVKPAEEQAKPAGPGSLVSEKEDRDSSAAAGILVGTSVLASVLGLAACFM